MTSIESGQKREFISTGVLRDLGALEDPNIMEAIARMPLSIQEVLAGVRPKDIDRGNDPLPPAA